METTNLGQLQPINLMHVLGKKLVRFLLFLGMRILMGISLEGGTRTMFEGAGVYHVGHFLCVSSFWLRYL